MVPDKTKMSTLIFFYLADTTDATRMFQVPEFGNFNEEGNVKRSTQDFGGDVHCDTTTINSHYYH